MDNRNRVNRRSSARRIPSPHPELEWNLQLLRTNIRKSIGSRLTKKPGGFTLIFRKIWLVFTNKSQSHGLKRTHDEKKQVMELASKSKFRSKKKISLVMLRELLLWTLMKRYQNQISTKEPLEGLVVKVKWALIKAKTRTSMPYSK